MGQKVTKQRLVVFHNAVRNGNTEKVKEMLEEGVQLDDHDDVFGTPLHEAACFDRLEIAEMLIRNKADVNSTQKHHGDTPLCVACKKGLLPHVELLVRNGAKINQQGKGGSTPLHCALENKHEDIAQFLVGASASVNILDSNGMSSLHIACKNLCKQSIELILSSNTSNTSTSSSIAGNAPFATTAASTTLNTHDKFNMTPFMYLFLIIYPICLILTVVMYACQAGDIQLVEILLRKGAKTKYDMGKNAPLHITTQLELAKLLIDNGADVNARDEAYSTPLHQACNNVNGGDLVALFLSHHADLSPHDSTTRATPLHCACKQGAFGNAELLLKNNASPNSIDIQKNTPLHVASMLGYSGIAQLLISHGADPNVLNAEGMTPAQLAMNADD